MPARTTLLLIGAALMMSACAARPTLPYAAFGPSDYAPVIEIANHYFQGMDVVLEVGGQRYPLGNVPALGAARFALPSDVVGAAARITMKPTGDLKVYRTRLVRYSGADDLRLIIAADPRQTALVVRD